ncbi:SulP family inorganic anion transporter [Winogradskyella alexanderae]|uniref:SulP family inorganic anion transporter n=1 Tax=Winogradskyella alexanderae TaxID=2877123 RepID=A0ABS7XMV5_9FLAO|nr:SulP family inorganic anion transporter [Winogradskyella alexanderae]MCA0131100.1 SulP family inorganic anion transporter [Winogradskyella alexanderae]
MKNFFSNIKGDAFGGITAGIVALPLALAFGVQSGLGPSAGLYGAIFISFFAALFGGTNTQISGPTAPMTALSMVVIAGLIGAYGGSVENALPAILTVFLLAGLMQIVLGVIGVGKYIRYIPYPVVSGFMTAIGVMILITQLLPILGYNASQDNEFVIKFRPEAEEVILEKIIKDEAVDGILVLEEYNKTIEKSKAITEEDIVAESINLANKESKSVLGAIKLLPRALKNINWLELILALGTIFVIYGFKRITTKIPSTLVALILVSSIAILGGFNYKPIPTIPQELPLPRLEIFTNFNVNNISPYIFTALTLALLGAIDSLLTSVVADNMTKTKHKPDKELIGQGIGNTVASIFGGIPGAGATIRTVVNINAGGKTRLSGMIAGILLFFILLAMAPLASKIPAAVLAGILITVGIGVMDYKGLKAIPNLPRDIKIGPIRLSSEVIIMLVVLLLSTFWNLVYAVGIGLVIASLMFMKKIGDLTAKRSDVISLQEEKWPDEIGFPEALKEEVFIKHLRGPLFFGSTNEFQVLSLQIPETASYVIMRMKRMQYMDQSGLYAMEDMIQDLKTKNVEVLFVGLLEQPRYMMERIDIIPDFIPEEHIFDQFEACLRWIKQNVEDKY